jgi:hypothetical protein
VYAISVTSKKTVADLPLAVGDLTGERGREQDALAAVLEPQAPKCCVGNMTVIGMPQQSVHLVDGDGQLTGGAKQLEYLRPFVIGRLQKPVSDRKSELIPATRL